MAVKSWGKARQDGGDHPHALLVAAARRCHDACKTGCVEVHLLMCGSSCKMTFSNELWISRWPLYLIKPNFRNLFIKKLTRERVVPIISASVSWLTFGMIASGRPSLPKFASKRRALA